MRESRALEGAVNAITSWPINGRRAPRSNQSIRQLFGINVFSDEVMKARLPENVYKAMRNTIKKGAPLDPSIADVVAADDAGMGDGARGDPLHPLVPADDRADGREARLVPGPDRGRHGHRRVQRQGAGPRRARRLELPLRRHPHHLRGPRLHRLGPDQPGVHPREPQRHDALHPDGLLLLDRRGPRQEDPPAPLDGGAVEAGRPHPPALRLRRHAGLQHGRARAGILPDRQALLLRPARPDQRRPDALRRQAPQGPGAGGPLLRRRSPSASWPACSRPRPSSTSWACRSRRGTTRSRRRSTRSPSRSRTPTSPPTTTCWSWRR